VPYNYPRELRVYEKVFTLRATQKQPNTILRYEIDQCESILRVEARTSGWHAILADDYKSIEGPAGSTIAHAIEYLEFEIGFLRDLISQVTK